MSDLLNYVAFVISSLVSLVPFLWFLAAVVFMSASALTIRFFKWR